MYRLNRACLNAVLIIVSTILLNWACTRPNYLDGPALPGDAGASPDSAILAAPSADASPDALRSDNALWADAVASEAASLAPLANAGQPRFAAVGQKVFLDGSRSRVPPGCTLSWKPDPNNPGVSTLSYAKLPMLEVSVSNPGIYRYIVSVTCQAGGVTDVTAIYAYDRAVATFPDKRFVYREESVPYDNTTTGAKGRRYVFDIAKHSTVVGPIKEVWIDVLGQRLKMAQSGSDTFSRWVPGASLAHEHSYWAFVDHNRFARALLPSVRVQKTTFSDTWKVTVTAPLYQSFGGPTVAYELYAHPGNGTTPVITSGASGEFLIAGKMTSPHLFYAVAFGQSHRSLPALITLPLASAVTASPDLGVIYQVYLRQFADGDGDGQGDLAGLTAKLKYLAHDLGVDTILLMPVFASPGQIKLESAPSDLSRVHLNYGTNKQLGQLFKQAHALGLRVLMDLPLDRVHPSFVPCAKALGNPASPTSNWFYFFQGNTTWFGAGFADQASGSQFFAPGQRPALAVNLDHPDARLAMIRSAVAMLDLDGDGKLDDGADGFRLHSHGGATGDFWRQLSVAVRLVSPGATLVGRRHGEASELGRLLREAGLGAVIDSPFNRALRGALRAKKAHRLYAHLKESLQHTVKHGVVIPQASSELTGRVITNLGGEGFGVALAAATLTLTAPGCPLILFGDELGLMAQGGNDPERRYGGAFLWGGKDPYQTNEPGGGPLNKPPPLWQQTTNKYSIYSHYKALLKIRKLSLPLRDPRAPGYHYSEFTDPGVFAMVRQSGSERVLVVVNLTAAFKKVSFSEQSKSTLLYRVGYGSGSTLGPYGTQIYRLP